MSLSRSTFLTNVWQGLRMGISVAIGFSLIAGGLSVAVGGNAFARYHLSFLGGIATYFAAGICVGAVGGALAPLMKTAVGLGLVGMILGFISDLVLQASMKGMGFWQHFSWSEACFFAAFGAPLAFYVRSSYMKGRERRRLRQAGGLRDTERDGRG
jgi:hypothetical protein